jgi:hypothetical protein
MIKRVRNWYNGTPVTIQFDNDPNGSILFGPIFRTDYHWTARVAHVLVDFYLRHWKWLWTTFLAIAALIVSMLALRPGSA